MKKTMLIVPLILLCCSVYADGPKAEKPLQIRVVSAQGVLSNLKEAKDIDARLQKQGKEWETKVRAIEESLQKKAKAFEEKKKSDAKEPELKKLQEELMDLQRDRENIAKSAQEKLKRAYQSELESVNKKIRDAVVSTAQRNNWDGVQLKETGEWLYASNRVEESSAIVDAMNREYDAAKMKEKLSKK